MSGVVFTGGLVVDGTGAAPRRADVVVADGMIVDVVEAGAAPGAGTTADRQAIDGLVITPGFVDIHAHSDLTRFAYPGGASRILQGITTEVIGNCGFSAAPAGGEGFRESIATIDVTPDVPITWSTPAEYLDALDALPAASNVAPLIGHGPVRRAVLGDAPEAPGPADLATMSMIVDDALAAGYWGLSIGLMYAPGELAGRTELVALARVVAANDALLGAHLRAYDGTGLVAAVTEALDVADASGVRLEISHLRSIADPTGRAIEEAIAVIRESHVDVEADAYPYLAGHTTAQQLLPPELRARGTSEILAEIAAGPDRVAAALRDAFLAAPEAISIVRLGDDGGPELGRTLADLARGQEGDAARVLVDLLARHDGAVDVIVVGTRPSDATRVLAESFVSVASDGVALALEHSANRPHPRSIGTFPRAFRELTDAGIPIERIVHKMTAKPAQRIGLAGRGRIAPGTVADLVVLDPDRMRDNAGYDDPLVPPSGIRSVWVAGECVAADGVATGRMPGVLLRRTR